MLILFNVIDYFQLLRDMIKVFPLIKKNLFIKLTKKTSTKVICVIELLIKIFPVYHGNIFKRFLFLIPIQVTEPLPAAVLSPADL